MSAAQRIGSLIPGVMKHTAQTHGPFFQIQRAWPRLVGKPLAAHTKPVSLRRGRLVVCADRPGDTFTLSYERPKLLAQLQTMTKGHVEEIVIRAGKV